MEEMTMNIGQSKKTLFRSAMKNDWGKILDICGKTPKAHTVQTTRTGDTLLHLAVADGKEEVVRQLAELITKPKNKAIKSTALGISNERKNILHIVMRPFKLKPHTCNPEVFKLGTAGLGRELVSEAMVDPRTCEAVPNGDGGTQVTEDGGSTDLK
ncbi:hypothetical protein LguiA_005905 [Lonicera macranthoides]